MSCFASWISVQSSSRMPTMSSGPCSTTRYLTYGSSAVGMLAARLSVGVRRDLAQSKSDPNRNRHSASDAALPGISSSADQNLFKGFTLAWCFGDHETTQRQPLLHQRRIGVTCVLSNVGGFDLHRARCLRILELDPEDSLGDPAAFWQRAMPFLKMSEQVISLLDISGVVGSAPVELNLDQGDQFDSVDVTQARASAPYSRNGSSVYFFFPGKQSSSPKRYFPNFWQYSFFSPASCALMRSSPS